MLGCVVHAKLPVATGLDVAILRAGLQVFEGTLIGCCSSVQTPRGEGGQPAGHPMPSRLLPRCLLLLGWTRPILRAGLQVYENKMEANRGYWHCCDAGFVVCMPGCILLLG
jgi:hypothetical protein